jgi:Tol biopolymer transport system component
MEKPSSGLIRDPPEPLPDVSGSTEVAIPVGPAPAAARRSRERSGDAFHDEDPMIGRTVDHYRIASILGGGGMGVVYKAEDTRLGRTVALKFLPPALTRDPVAKSRFLQEARAASALDHPNVCTVYDIGETDDGQLYLVMPAYDGETLKRKIERGPLPVEEAVDVAKQVCQGLAKAHRRGIVHRDVKPPNLIVTTDGIVKILDFGLAKLAGAAGLTRAGFCVGTPSYMSPEQARGEVDHRTDLWSLGVVLYEMLTGVLPFQAESDPGIVHAVLHDEPAPLARWRPDAPAGLERVLTGLLKKDLADRYPTAENVLTELRALGGPPTRSRPSTELPRKGRRLRQAAVLAAVAVLGAAVVALVLREGRGPVRDGQVVRLTLQPGSERQPALSPTGEFFVYAKRSGGDFDLFWERIQGENPVNLTADYPQDDTDPAVSPDGGQIAFRSEREGGGIYLMGSTGESARRLTDFGYSPAWSPDGAEIAFATEGVPDPSRRFRTSQLWRVRLADGATVRVTAEDAVQPSWSPGGQRIAYWGTSAVDGERALWTIRRDGREPVRVTGGGSYTWRPVWSPDGRYLYFISDRDGSMNLWRVRIDQDTGRVEGELESLRAPSEAVSGLSLAAGKDGTLLLYATDDSVSNVERVGFDPVSGQVGGPLPPVTQGPWAVRSADVSPDGQWVVFDTEGTQEDLYLVRAADGTGLRKLTSDKHKDRIPRWSPDGTAVLFYSNRSGKYEAWKIRADGSGLERLTGIDEPVYNPVWSPDARRLVCSLEFQGAALIDLAQPLERRRPQPLRVRGMPGTFAADSWSADGRWLAGAVTGPGVFVYSMATGRGSKLTESGGNVAWLHDSRRLVYLDEGRLFLLDVPARQSRELLAPLPNSEIRRVGVSRDDRTFFLVRHLDEGNVWMMKLK